MEKFDADHKMTTLLRYGTDLTKMAQEGKLDPIIGRSEQIERVTQILCRRRKNNPCLIGEPGVGKTVIAEGLALHMVNGQLPPKLQKKKIVSIDMARVVAGTTYRGDFEERLVKIVDEVKQSDGDIILFVDEVHSLIGAGDGCNALNIWKPALARGEMKLIGATTLSEYKKYIEKDVALERRFQPVKVPEPSTDEAIQILEGVSKCYASYHNVKYAEEAIVSAVKLSQRYISDRNLPDKAIDLIDEAGSRVYLSRYNVSGPIPVVTELDIQQAVTTVTGIPVEKVSKKDSKRLLKMEEVLHKHVIGQTEAVNVISRAIRRSRVGIRDPCRPIGCFLFTGPTGVGKTELANVLAAEYFGSKEAMIRLDMSEYYERHTVSKLIGSPPGYVGYDEGGQLTELVRHSSHSVILLDEIEKAHPDVFNILLQILDDGRLTDNKGRTIDFKNTIIIMTSNIGSGVIGKGGSDNGSSETNARVAEELKKFFKPEFLNRLDEVIIFHQLTKSEVERIANMMLEEVSKRLKEKKIKLLFTKSFKEKIADDGYSPSYGARPLRRTITRLLEDILAEKMLSGEINEGDSVMVDIGLNGNVLLFPNSLMIS
ncbi:Chaperone protein clpb [Thalictrum thalictroides]|uniref:Chaperone protein clpb n=1 Tax=Thalictrum thalictroides TaxID=46969 RepID=A0A7J6WNS3_THATH|nr:Chaperone protein clpb [Thalictrum thalictroides]